MVGLETLLTSTLSPEFRSTVGEGRTASLNSMMCGKLYIRRQAYGTKAV